MTKMPDPYHGFRFPAEIISHAVWLYHGFSLSLRDVETILAQRGIVVSYESIRRPAGRRRRATSAAPPTPTTSRSCGTGRRRSPSRPSAPTSTSSHPGDRGPAGSAQAPQVRPGHREQATRRGFQPRPRCSPRGRPCRGSIAPPLPQALADFSRLGADRLVPTGRHGTVGARLRQTRGGRCGTRPP